MHLLRTQADGHHLCLLDDEEVAPLQRSGALVLRREEFLRRLFTLPLDETTWSPRPYRCGAGRAAVGYPPGAAHSSLMTSRKRSSSNCKRCVVCLAR